MPFGKKSKPLPVTWFAKAKEITNQIGTVVGILGTRLHDVTLINLLSAIYPFITVRTLTSIIGNLVDTGGVVLTRSR